MMRISSSWLLCFVGVVTGCSTAIDLGTTDAGVDTAFPDAPLSDVLDAASREDASMPPRLYPATGRRPVGEEFPFDGRVVRGAFDEPARVELAFDGERYLAVWFDEGVIYGIRLDLEGRPIDPYRFAIGAGECTPEVVSREGGFVVAWCARLATGLATIVSVDGATARVEELMSFFSARELSLASDGENVVIAFERGSPGVYVRIVYADGTLGPSGAFGEFVSGSESSARPSIAFDGEGFLVAWHDDEGVWALPFAFDTVPWDVRLGEVVRLSESPGDASVSAAGADGTFLIGWSGERDAGVHFFARRVSDGVILDASGPLALGLTPPSSPVLRPHVAALHEGFVVLGRREGLRSAHPPVHVFADGRIEPSQLPEAYRAPFYAASTDGHRSLFVDTRARSLLVDEMFEPTREEPLFFAALPNQQSHPSIATNGDIALAIWLDGRSDESSPTTGSAHGSVYGARVSSTGELLDENALSIHDSGGALIARFADGFVVAARDAEGTSLVRVSAEGERSVLDVDVGGRVVSASAHEDGAIFGIEESPTQMAVLSLGADASTRWRALIAPQGYRARVSATIVGGVMLAWWVEQHGSGRYSLRIQRFSAIDGTSLTRPEVVADRVLVTDEDVFRVAGANDWYTVVWSASDDAEGRAHVYTRTYDVETGVPWGPALKLSTSMFEQSLVTLCADSQGMVALWNQTDAFGTTLRAARFLPGGARFDGVLMDDGWEVHDSAVIHATCSRIGVGQFLVGYAREVGDLGVARTFGRFVDYQRPPF